ncbi:MAG: hypothetical protein ABGX05_12870, partial [Pirellulaceae bacterium]
MSPLHKIVAIERVLSIQIGCRENNEANITAIRGVNLGSLFFSCSAKLYRMTSFPPDQQTQEDPANVTDAPMERQPGKARKRLAAFTVIGALA